MNDSLMLAWLNQLEMRNQLLEAGERLYREAAVRALVALMSRDEAAMKSAESLLSAALIGKRGEHGNCTTMETTS